MAATLPTADNEVLRMRVDYPDGQQRYRMAQDGLMQPVAILLNQTVTITLDFPNRDAGAPLFIGAIDGGDIDFQSPTTLPANGRVSFSFRADGNPGVCHLLVTGVGQYCIPLFVIDPHRAPRPSQNANSH